MFKVGELAVYPAQGVGLIEAIEDREIMGAWQKFYVMKILGNGMKIMIPTDTARTIGLRELITSKEIPRIYEILRTRDVTIDKQAWNKRYREYLEKIKTGSRLRDCQGPEGPLHPQARKGPVLRREEDDGYSEALVDQGDLDRQPGGGGKGRSRDQCHVPRSVSGDDTKHTARKL